MVASPTDDPVLACFRAAVETAYGSRIARIVLFGSRARGDARPDSDYDIGLFLHDLLQATGAVVNALPLPVDAYAERTAWMREVRHDGVPL